MLKDIIITHRGTVGQISYIAESSRLDNYMRLQNKFRGFIEKNLNWYISHITFILMKGKRLYQSHVWGVSSFAESNSKFPFVRIYYSVWTTKVAKVLSDLDTKMVTTASIPSWKLWQNAIYDYWFGFDFLIQWKTI
jgi:type I restriction enzyme S subunit